MALLIGPTHSKVPVRRPPSAVLLAVLLASTLPAQTPSVEYRVKAAYIFNFAKFVTWPQAAFAAPDAPIVIGILGKDPFGGAVDQAVAGKLVERRPLQVRRLSSADKASGCHILFIASSERQWMPDILKDAQRTCMLTVGETEDFLEIGGMIQFVPHENNIRLQVNLDATQAAGLKISSKLLQIATVVKGKARQ